MRTLNKDVFAGLVAIFTLPPALASAADETLGPGAATQNHSVQIYHTPRERREAGSETKLTEHLFFSGMVEVQATSFDNQFREKIPNAGRDDAATAVQLGFKLEMSDEVEAEIVLDFDDSKTGSALEEAFIEIKSGNWGWTAGTQTLPFGAYYSHFITGPLLEFGETRKTALRAGYDYPNRVEFSALVFNGVARKQNVEQRIDDWAAAAEATLIGNRLTIGASYLSDIADSDENLLDDFANQYQRSVGAWSAYAVARFGAGEISFEILRSTRAFHELPSNANQPRAWNFELAYYPAQNWQVAARVERSDELPDQPAHRYGIAATWLAYDAVTLAVEYLRADFKRAFVFDDNGNEVRHQSIWATQLSLEF